MFRNTHNFFFEKEYHCSMPTAQKSTKEAALTLTRPAGAKLEYHATVHDMPTDQRPRERLRDYGPQALSNAELLAIILRTGT